MTKRVAYGYADVSIWSISDNDFPYVAAPAHITEGVHNFLEGEDCLRIYWLQVTIL